MLVPEVHKGHVGKVSLMSPSLSCVSADYTECPKSLDFSSTLQDP